jgi:hypothetical protein
MTQRNLRHKSFVFRRRPCSGLILSVLLCVLLTACVNTSSEKPPELVVNIPTDLLPDRAGVQIQRVDTDSDGKLEWLAFYRFDQVGESGPVAALIYDVAANSGQLPVLYPYKLRTPNQSYLAQVVPKWAMMEIMPESGGPARKELVLSTDNDLAIFQANGNVINQPSDDPPLYRCIGFFGSDGGVVLDAESHQVAVTSRAGYERSQLVTRYYYAPQADGYFVTGTTTLVSPFGSAVDFPEGVPPAILDTPYPEKIVLAFYKTFGKADAKPTLLEYLTTQAGNELMAGRLRYGSPFPLDQVNYAVVKELGYFPTQDDSQATVVTVKVVFASKAGQKSSLTEIRWSLLRQENRWKIDFPQQ